jgi:hypothetical protein
MSETKQAINSLNNQRMTIRIGRNTLAFTAIASGEENLITYEPYVVKSGVSMAANLREAFKGADFLSAGITRVRILLDTPVLMTPVELFQESKMQTLYYHAFPQASQDAVFFNVLPELNAVAIFSINRDLKLVIDDHFQDVQFVAALTPVWRHLYQRSFTGQHNKLYGYFHDRQVDIFSFQQNRFKFCNLYETSRMYDALYFLLYVWNQLMFNAETDELHLAGNMPEEGRLVEELKKYVKKVYVINPAADFAESPVSQIKKMPYDLMTLYAKER